MPSRYDMYGFQSMRLDEAAILVQNALGIQLTEGESSYYAGRYFRYRLSSGRELKLYRNHDPASGSVVRSEFASHGVVLEVSDLDAMETIEIKLTSGRDEPVLLRSRTIEDDPEDEPDE